MDSYRQKNRYGYGDCVGVDDDDDIDDNDNDEDETAFNACYLSNETASDK